MMRYLPAFQAVMYMSLGFEPSIACEKALTPVAIRYPKVHAALVCVAANGRHGAAAFGWTVSYTFQDAHSGGKPQVVSVKPFKPSANE
mmetsp:Transcript_5972/g.9467  ORF Transcript_5972/g.9467 Transcript_5972/m.9467 type:complete len:88 (+) Transcript_5972:1184-1447(+)